MPCKPQWYNLEHYPKTNAPVSKWISSGQQAQEHARILGMSDHPKREKEQILRSSSDGTQGCCLGSYLSTPVGCLSGLHVLWRKGRILSVPPSSVSFLPFSFLPSSLHFRKKSLDRKLLKVFYVCSCSSYTGGMKATRLYQNISTVAGHFHHGLYSCISSPWIKTKQNKKKHTQGIRSNFHKVVSLFRNR